MKHRHAKNECSLLLFSSYFSHFSPSLLTVSPCPADPEPEPEQMSDASTPSLLLCGTCGQLKPKPDFSKGQLKKMCAAAAVARNGAAPRPLQVVFLLCAAVGVWLPSLDAFLFCFSVPMTPDFWALFKACLSTTWPTCSGWCGVLLLVWSTSEKKRSWALVCCILRPKPAACGVVEWLVEEGKASVDLQTIEGCVVFCDRCCGVLPLVLPSYCVLQFGILTWVLPGDSSLLVNIQFHLLLLEPPPRCCACLFC